MIGLLTVLASAGAAESPLAEGRYVLTLHQASRTKVPVFGWTPSVTTSEVLVELERTAEGWMQSQQICEVRVESHGKRGHTTIPDAFVEALPDKRYPVTLEPGERGVRYTADLGVDHVGYDPSLTDEVPDDPDDPGVVDSDGDGAPGATVRVSVPLMGSGDIYVVQRASMRLDGVVGADGTVSGRIVVDELTQRTLDATHLMFKGSPRIEPVTADSWFTMRPAPRKRCEDL